MSSEQTDRDVDEWVAEYSQLISQFGMDSSEARAFFDEHADDEDFTELASVVGELRRTHAEKEEAQREASRLSRKVRIATGIAATTLLFLVAVGLAAVGYKVEADRAGKREKIAQQKKEIALKEGYRLDLLERLARTMSSEELPSLDTSEIPPSGEMYLPESPPPVRKELAEELSALARQFPDDVADGELMKLDKEVVHIWAKTPAGEGNIEGAQKRFKRVTRLRPNWSRPVYSLGVLSHDQSPEQAERYYDRAWNLSRAEGKPRSLAANNLAMLKLKAAERLRKNDNTKAPYVALLRQAVDWVKRAREVDPDNHLVADTQAQIYLELAEAAEAGVELKESKLPNDWRKLAIESYRKAVENCPRREARRLLSGNIEKLEAEIKDQ